MANPTMKKPDIVVALLLIPICLYVFYESGRWPVPALLGRPFVIPRGVATVLLLAALLLLSRALTGRSLPLEKRLEGADRRRVTWVAILTFAYLFAVVRLGFDGTTFLYMLGFLWVLGERRWSMLILVAALTPLVVYVIFDTLLNVPLPRGTVEDIVSRLSFGRIR